MLEYDGLPDFSRQVESRDRAENKSGRMSVLFSARSRKRWTLDGDGTGEGLFSAE